MNDDVKNLLFKTTNLIESIFPSLNGFTQSLENQNSNLDEYIDGVIDEYKIDNSNLYYNSFKLFIDILSKYQEIKVTYVTNNNMIFEECNICMDNLANSETSCKHWICEICWIQIIKDVKNEKLLCPFCRQKVTELKINKL